MATAPKAALSKSGTRSTNRAEIVDQNFIAAVQALSQQTAPRPRAADAPVRDGSTITAAQFREIFDSQLMSRHMDLVAREMRSRNEGFYTIGSSGHEANAVVGYLTRITDPAFLHYRSGGFMMARTPQAAGLRSAVRHRAVAVCEHRRSDFRWSPQSVGLPTGLGSAADFDHCQPSLQGGRHRGGAGAGQATACHSADSG